MAQGQTNGGIQWDSNSHYQFCLSILQTITPSEAPESYIESLLFFSKDGFDIK